MYRIQLAAESAVAHDGKLGDRQACHSLLSGITAQNISKVSMPQNGVSELGGPTCLSACGEQLCLGGHKGTLLSLPSASFSNPGQAASVMLMRPPESQFQRFIGGLFKATPTSPIVSLVSLAQLSPGLPPPGLGTSDQQSDRMGSLACALHGDGALRIWDTASHMQVLHQGLQPPEPGLLAKQIQRVPYGDPEQQQQQQQATRQAESSPAPPTGALFMVHWMTGNSSQTKVSSIRIQAQLDDDAMIQAVVHENSASLISHAGPIRGLTAVAAAEALEGATAGSSTCWVVGESGVVSTHGDPADEASFVQLVEEAPTWESSAQASLASINVSSVLHCSMALPSPQLHSCLPSP